jgi:hypothetical protein
VRLGYEVIEEYLRAGRNAASARTDAKQAAAPAHDPQLLTQRLFQYGSDFANVGLELLQALTLENAREPAKTPTRPKAAPQLTAAQQRRTPATPSGSLRTIKLQCDSPRRVQFELKLAEQAALAGTLVARMQQSDGQQRRRMRGVKVLIAAVSGSIEATLCVPKGIAPGRYRGELLGLHDHQPCGSIALTVYEA